MCSYGATSRSCDEAAKEARRQGLKVGTVSLKTLWPFPDFFFKSLGSRIKTIVVCEMNMGQILREVQRISRGSLRVVGVNSVRGTMITPQEILNEIQNSNTTK